MCPAGPFPTKAMFEEQKKKTQNLSYVEDLGGGSKYHVPTFQLNSGTAIYSLGSSSYEPLRSPSPIKTLELSWENIQLMVDAVSVRTFDNEPLTSADVESVDIVPFSPAHPRIPLTRDWFPRQSWGLTFRDDSKNEVAPDWQQRFLENSSGVFGTTMFFHSEYPAAILASGIIRITFTGDGTLKLRNESGYVEKSNPAVKLVAKDANGEEVPGAYTMGTHSRQAGGRSIGFLSPSSLPISTAPVPVDQGGTSQGMIVVWPSDGSTPYLQLYRQGSGSSGAGVEYHIPFLPGLPGSK